MSSNPSVLPANYGYTALACATTFLLHLYQMETVSKARREAGVKYPQFYAEKAEMVNDPAAVRFNCAQRAHGNTLEVLPVMLFGSLFSGLYFPLASAGLMSLWVVSRVGYTIGYASGDPEKRRSNGGSLHLVGGVGVMALTFWSAGKMIWATL